MTANVDSLFSEPGVCAQAHGRKSQAASQLVSVECHI